MTTFIKRILATVTVIVFVFAMLPISALADVDSGNMGLQIGADAPGVDIVLRRTKDLGSGEIWDGGIAENFAGGSGTEDDPYLISNGAELAYLAQQVNSGTNYEGLFIELTADIYLNDTTGWENWGEEDAIAPVNEWTAIGLSPIEYDDYSCSFCGTFNGNGYAIFGMYINVLGEDEFGEPQGLFGCSYGTIASVGVEDSAVLVDGYMPAGGVVGSNNGDIANCYNTGRVMGRYGVGGVIGSHRGGTITNCYNAGTVEGSGSVGGVLGGNSGDRMDNIISCYNTGTVSGFENTGGVVGDHYGAIITCYNIGDILGVINTGGIVGNLDGDITNCYNVGTIAGEDNVGGVAGLAYRIISNCYNTGTVTGDSNIGGIVGEHYDRVIACYNIGTVSGNESFGPIAGLDDGDQDEEIEIDCYYLDTCCPFGSSSGTALTDEQMQDAENFAGLDFETVWTIEGNPEYPYPELRSNPHFIYPDEPGILGDFDGDGEITAIDAVNILRVALGILNGDGNINADYDCDGEITALDAIKVLRVALGLVEGNELYSYPEALWP